MPLVSQSWGHSQFAAPGIDEHRCRQVRFFRDPETAKWCRYETWLTARSPAWRDEVQVVAIDPSAAFRKAMASGHRSPIGTHSQVADERALLVGEGP